MTQKTTRERILEVASELFIDKGYEATSLREIADRLGFTKAALYYHFQSKDQLLTALFEPTRQLIGELMDRLAAADGIEAWGETLAWLIGQMAEYLDFLQLMQRNRTAIDQLGLASAAFAEHGRLFDQVEAAATAKGADLREQVRMIAALGAVTSFDDWAPHLLADTPPELLRAELTAAVNDILGLPRR